MLKISDLNLISSRWLLLAGHNPASLRFNAGCTHCEVARVADMFSFRYVMQLQTESLQDYFTADENANTLAA
jgi:hypothetical protein